MRTANRNKQKGFTLTEGLVAFAITATGFLAVASFQNGLIGESAQSKARSEALSLAQQKIEQFKHYTHADETNFIDDNNDGVMDLDDTYSDAAIDGQNAVFTRSWVLTTTNAGKQIDVTVSWTDASGQDQSVMLGSLVPWLSPRAGADQIAGTTPPTLISPTGRAQRGEGNLSAYPNATLQTAVGVEGMAIYQNEQDLLLVDGQNNVFLTLLDACNLQTGTCTDFVRIGGTVYMDTSNTNEDLIDTYVIASDAAHCERWVPSGSLASPPTTASGDYEYYNYTCYLGGGWHGNIGFVTASGIEQTDKVCQGDPTSFNSWEQPVIALRRAYRGILEYTYGGQTYYESHGIKDAAVLTGHDYVFTKLPPNETLGTACTGINGPMTRTDSSSGTLFTGVPTDFFCLNKDIDGDSLPDYLDAYDPGIYTAGTTCPFDPSDPPVSVHTISGVVAIASAQVLDLSSVEVVTSDGPGNCEWTTPLDDVAGGYAGTYECNVYDWGSGWTGYIQLQPNSNVVYCPNDRAEYTDLSSSQTHSFACVNTDVVIIGGSLSIGDRAELSTIKVYDGTTSDAGYCNVGDVSYTCVLPYDGDAVDLVIVPVTTDVACGATGGEYYFAEMSAAGNRHRYDIAIEWKATDCP